MVNLFMWSVVAVPLGIFALIAKPKSRPELRYTPSPAPPAIQTLPPSSDYPESVNGVRIRVNPDRSVNALTPQGPRRFQNWQEFWSEVGEKS